jgi:hypothetical protein
MPSRKKRRSLEDWVAETEQSVAARLEGVKTAQAQTRLTLGTMAVISVMMLIASYNAYVSYDYNWLVRRNCPEEILTARNEQEKEKEEDKTELARELQVLGELSKDIVDRNKALTEHSMKEWASSRTVMISLLGIRVSVDDAAVLGTAVLFFLSLWLFLAARRENHTTGFLLRDTDSPRPAGQGAAAAEGVSAPDSNGERWLIYHAVISNSLFVTFDTMPNVDKLHGPNSLQAAAAEDKRGALHRQGLKFTRGFFFWFPFVVSGVVFVLDRRSYFKPDPFVVGCEPEGASPFFWFSTAAFLLCLVPLGICCRKASQLSSRTETVLREYGANLLRDLKREERRRPKRRRSQRQR